MNYFLYDTLLSMFNIIIPMCILMFLSLFYIRYIRLSKYKELNTRKKDTVDFCFRDKTNYEKFIYLAETSDFNKYNHNIENSEAEILSILTTFDKISIALNNNVFDEKIIIEYYGKYFVQFYSIFRYFILKRRESSRNPELFIEYEKLARRWFENSEYIGGGMYER